MELREEVVLMYTTEDILKEISKINSTNLPGNEMDMVKRNTTIFSKINKLRNNRSWK